MRRRPPGPEKQLRRDSTPYYIKPLALALPLYLIGVHISTWFSQLPLFLAGMADLRHLYVAGLMLRTGHRHELYEKAAQQFFQSAYVSPGDFPMQYNHLAYEALLYAPFSIFSYRTAYFVFLAFNVILLVAVYRLIRSRMDNIAAFYPWLPAALVPAFLPIGVALMQGQDSIVLLLVLAGALLAFDRGKDFLAGILVALGLFKFTVALPIAFFFFVWRRWRFTVGFSATATGLAVASLAIAGTAQTIKYLHLLTAMGVKLSSATDQFTYGIRIATMPNLRGLVFGLAGAHAPAVVQGITITLSIMLVVWAAMAGRKLNAADQLLFAITASAVVSYHFLFHDMSVLFLPIVCVLNRAKLGSWPAALLFVAPVWWAFSPNHFYLVCVPLCAFLFSMPEKESGALSQGAPLCPGKRSEATTSKILIARN